MFKWNSKPVISAVTSAVSSAVTSTVTRTVQEGMTLEQVRAAMLQLLAAENTNHHRMGQFYNYVVQNKLAEKAGHKDAREYFGQHLADVSQSALSMYGAVAAAFTEAVCGRFGVTCLYLLLTYKEAADMEVSHEEPGGTVIEVPGQNGEVTPKPFSECTVDQMRKAIQRKRKPASSKPLPAEDVARAEQYRVAVTGRFAKGDPVRVQVRNHKGKAVLDFKGIPLAQVSKLIEGLSAPPSAVAVAVHEAQAETAPFVSLKVGV
jgi:hypothetical protein